MRISPRLTLNNGVMVDRLGFGLYKVPPADAAGLVTAALEAGYRHFDTAAMYGNETGVGKAVGALSAFDGSAGGSGELHRALAREDLFVTTKLWNDDQGYDATLRAFDASISRLGLAYVDLYLIHWPCAKRGLFTESYRALETLYREGRVRAIGVSNFQPAHLERLLQSAEVVPAVNQIELHPWLQQAELRALHASLGITTEAWSPLGRGQVLQDPVVLELSAAHRRSAAQIILRWHLEVGNVVIPKASSSGRIRENHDIFGFSLGTAGLDALAGLERGFRTGSNPDNVN
ncbi:aldo/keto reductase [Arthrobacter sp. UYEF3]|uniref:aldo/keto reductase n=1 Tax=Arthrobacter sp. UYEF3 TaxID=1756365 RepID=UPI003392ABDB